MLRSLYAPCRLWPMLVSIVALSSTAPATAQTEQLVDRVVAVVDEDPIFASDIDQSLALGEFAGPEGESPEAARRRVLDALIDDRLRRHEVDRLDSPVVPRGEVDAQLDGIAERFGGRDALEARLQSVGLDESGLRRRIRRQLRLLRFVEERLAPRVLVDDEEILAYYEGPFARDILETGSEPPPLQEVRDAIAALLQARSLDEEIADWTARLRRGARIDVRPRATFDVLPLPPSIFEATQPPPSRTGS